MCIVRTIIYKYLEISLKAVYLQNAWCVFYAILCHSIVIQGNPIGVVSSGLLAELPAILDSFLPIPQVVS